MVLRFRLLISLGVIGVLYACSSDDPTRLLGCPHGPCTEAISNPGRTSWQAMENELLAACGNCHDAGGMADMPFLAGPEPYRSFVSWPGIVAPNPEQSLLLTHATGDNGHEGKNLDSPSLVNTLLPRVKVWLADEAKNFTKPPEDVGYHVKPFVPILGFNAIYLDELGTDFKGMAITFNAISSIPSMLELTEIEMHPTAQMGVRVTHSLMVVHPIGKPPVPVDGFGSGEQTFEAGKYGKLGNGILVLTNWSKDAKLSVAFQTIAPYDSAEPQDYGCKDITAFDAYARPQVVACLNCHGGPRLDAVAAVDMTGLLDDLDPLGVAKACGQIKNRINTTIPQSSALFVTTDPSGNAVHEYKFLGSASAFGSFRNSVSQWIEAEQ